MAADLRRPPDARAPALLSPALLALCALSLAACNGDGGAGEGEVSIAEYAALSEGASWTYRDDLSTEEVDDERLIRAHHLGEGLIELRRGARWADASPVAALAFSEAGGLSLVAWEFGPDAGEAELPLADAQVADGDLATAAGWSCSADLDASVETFYGTFSDTVVFDCSRSSSGLPGVFTFAREVGLISLVANSGVTMDLVAPY